MKNLIVHLIVLFTVLGITVVDAQNPSEFHKVEQMTKGAPSPDSIKGGTYFFENLKMKMPSTQNTNNVTLVFSNKGLRPLDSLRMGDSLYTPIPEGYKKVKITQVSKRGVKIEYESQGFLTEKWIIPGKPNTPIRKK